jgi:hypothetical protein
METRLSDRADQAITSPASTSADSDLVWTRSASALVADGTFGFGTSGLGYVLKTCGSARRSVHAVERVAQGFVETSPRDLVEVADGLAVEISERDRDDVVAADGARFREAIPDAEFHFGSDSTNCPCDGRTGDGGEYSDRSVPGEHADRAAARGRSEIGPVDVVAGYHAGAVLAASLRADWTTAGSAG